jgi:hypothetical protein
MGLRSIMPTEPVSSPTIQNGGFNDSYTANNQLFGYAYDAAGNLLSDGLFNQMTWDAENHISTVAGATTAVNRNRVPRLHKQLDGYLGTPSGHYV